ncbi:hypothetical protein LRP67_16900 [Nocardioides sp. cx-169]|uniref:RNA polymerase sigma factor n=1 Tax=Nocardioides sp. cx-169 TaxID=2899080 RepID=UPI001E4CDE52|nr:sigma factor [Nocardioides sp. cx-169]MCD4535770.1 hypothetical protein [Nocardioides sp. cx-169]
MDEREFDDLDTASFTRVTAQLYAMIGDRDEAQECVQEAFVRAWAHRRQLETARRRRGSAPWRCSPTSHTAPAASRRE